MLYWKQKKIHQIGLLFKLWFRLRWKSQLRCWRRLTGSCQNLFFFRLRHQNVSLLISHMKLLGLERFLMSFDIPFLLLMRLIFWSWARLRFLDILQNRWVVTLKHALKCESWIRLSRCISTQINRFWLYKCVKSSLISIKNNLTVG